VAGAGARRVQHWLAVVTIGGLVLATAAAFVITEKLKLTKSPISGTRVAKTFSPVCGCDTDNASVSFRLRRGGAVEVAVIDPGGRVVRSLARRRLRTGWVSFRWLGRDQSGRLSPDGDYKIRVHLISDHRTIVFPNVIRLDTKAPRIDQFSVLRRAIFVGERTRISYRFRSSAHPILLVDGREAVYGRFAHASGTLDWFGKMGGVPVRPGAHRLVLEARDDAGNTSARTGSIVVRVKVRASGGRLRRHKRIR
jgi:hypothetical protein